MGIFLILAMLGGILLGGLGTTALVVAAILVVRRRALHWTDALVFLGVTVLAVAVVVTAPYAEVRPGGDYDIAAWNLFLQGAGCTLALGVGAMGAAVFAWRRPVERRSLGDD